METASLIVTVRGYLDLLEQGGSPCTLDALAGVLAGLALARHGIEESAPADPALEAPGADYDRWRRLAELRFPGFGVYSVAPDSRGASEPALGDALDDLADIACDLSEVRWLWENASPGAAVWQYRFNYETHFGRHLDGLTRYVHDLMSAP